MFRFLDLKPFGPVCGSSTCERDAVDKFDDIGGVKKEKKRKMKKDDSEKEMYVNENNDDTKFYFYLFFSRVSEEESDDDFLLETVDQKEVAEEMEVGLNSEIFGFILKMKEKERLKLVTNF